ncbi:ATP-binding cassette domain-containing protein [Enterococcus cecorum]|nr:ABC transporter ATP-binding protein [Enterococcus cecorum]
MSNVFQGYATLYVLNALSYLPKKVQQFSLQLAKRNVRAAKVHAFSTFLSSFANVFSQIVITGYSGWLIFRSIISFGAFLTIENLSANVMNAMGNLANCLIMISSVQPIFEKYEPLQRKEKQQIINQKLPDHTLQLENVDFSYEDNVIFNRLSLTFEAGKKYIITGASGSGKSTLFHLLTGKISPTSGKLTIGGVDYAQLSANQIHEEISYVDQVPYVFEASIEENLTLLQDFSHQQLQQVLTSTQFAQVTTQLPQQLATQLGPSELELSGGQKQRLALARTLLRDTPILLLDETTANLDKDTAEQIERYLLSLPNHTVIMITHHLNPKLAGLYDEVIDLSKL